MYSHPHPPIRFALGPSLSLQGEVCQNELAYTSPWREREGPAPEGLREGEGMAEPLGNSA
jgi:hypothetical protein